MPPAGGLGQPSFLSSRTARCRHFFPSDHQSCACNFYFLCSAWPPRTGQIRALDAACLRVNNPPDAANSATGFSGPKYTQAHTAPHRKPAFFYVRNSCGVVCRFLAAVCGEPQGSPVLGRSANPHTVRHPFAVAGGDSTQRELSMEIRYASCGTGIRSRRLVRAARVVPSSIRGTP